MRTPLVCFTALPFIFSSLLVQAQSSSAPALEEVIVVASGVDMPLRQVGASVTTINKQEIMQRGYTQLADILRTQPSIAVSNSGGIGKQTAIRIRGEESFRTTILIDGINITDPTSTQAQPRSGSLALSSDIQKIEILRGPQGFIYGADAGGVISISTLSNVDNLHAGGSLESGTHNTNTLNAFVANGSAAGEFFLSAYHQKTDGFNARTSDLSGEADGNTNTTLHAKLKANINDIAYAKFVVRNISNDAQFDNCSGPNFSSSNDCETQNDTTLAKAELGLSSANINHKASFGYTTIEQTRFFENNISGNPEGTIEELQYLADIALNKKINITAGFDVQTHSIEDLTQTNSLQKRDQNAAFIELQSQPTDAFTVTAGIRHDDVETVGDHLSGRISGAFLKKLDTNTDIKYRASIGNGFRAPSLFEIDFNNGRRLAGQDINFDLKEEKTQGLDMGFDIYKEKANVSLTYFYQEVNNAIGFNFESGDVQNYTQLDGTSVSKGVELNLRYQFVPQFALTYNATVNKTAIPTGEARLRRPTHLSNLGADFNLLDNKLNILANLRAARDAIDFGNVSLDDYIVLDISATYTVNNNIELFGRVNNAGDVNYTEVNGFKTQGSAVYAGARFKL